MVSGILPTTRTRVHTSALQGWSATSHHNESVNPNPITYYPLRNFPFDVSGALELEA